MSDILYKLCKCDTILSVNSVKLVSDNPYNFTGHLKEVRVNENVTLIKPLGLRTYRRERKS